MCPECGHGSSEIRDERAHLDAHRQLRAFFQEWDAGTESGQAKARRSRRRLAGLYAAVALVLVLLIVGTFSRITRDSGAHRTSAPAIVIPDATMIPPAPPAPTAPPAVSPTAPPAGRTAPAARPTSPAPTNTGRDGSFVPSPASAAEPQRPVAPATVPPQVVVPATPHVLSVCLLGICLNVL